MACLSSFNICQGGWIITHKNTKLKFECAADSVQGTSQIEKKMITNKKDFCLNSAHVGGRILVCHMLG